jgi:heme-degrading monooxygenase HmoA
MIVTIFRSRLVPEATEEYALVAERLSALTHSIPGHVSHKTFAAEDGERVTIVEFETEEALQAWAAHPDHIAAKEKGRAKFYSEYRVQVCRVERPSAQQQAIAPSLAIASATAG